jgi:HK97 family phage portal protein
MAFVVTSGQLQSVQQAPDYQYGPWTPRALALSPSLTLTYEALWRAQPALRAVTAFLARNVAQLPLDVYRRISDTDREKALDHPLATLLERPLDGTKWTKYRLLNTLMLDLCVFDNAYWLKVVGPSGVRGLQPVPPRMMHPRGKNLFAPDYYELIGNRKRRQFAPSEVVHFHGYNPDDPRAGVAPVETLRQILAEEHSAQVYREQMWRNGARTAGYITRPKDAPRWSKDARDGFKADWSAQYTGESLATGGTPVLEDGMKYEGASITPKDAQYVESRKLTREEVAVAYHVSPVMLGLMDGANFGSIRELHIMLYQDTLAPTLEQIEQDIECQLLDDIDPTARTNRSVYVEFNLKSKLAGSFEEQAKALQSAVGGPWMARNEARAMHNLGAIDGADELIVPLNVVTGGLASPNDTAPDDPSNEESNKGAPTADILRRYFTRQSKAVASRLGAGETDPAALLDAARWDIELAADLGRVHAAGLAAAINDLTRVELTKALGTDDPARAVADLFAGYADTRAVAIAHDLEATT